MKHFILLTCLLRAALLPAQTPSVAFGIGGADDDRVTDIAVNPQHASFVTGWFHGAVDFDPGAGTALQHSDSTGMLQGAFLAAYDSAGQHAWSLAFTTIDSAGDVIGKAVAASSGSVLVGCDHRGSLNDIDPGSGTTMLSYSGSLHDFFIAQYASSGSYQWSVSISGNGDQLIGDISLDAQGNCYITGKLGGPAVDFDPGPGTFLLASPGAYNAFVASYDPNGQLRWAFTLNGTYSEGNCIATDAAGNVLVGGSFKGTNVEFDPGAGTAFMNSSNSGSIVDGYIAKYSSAGQYLWSIRLEQNGAGTSGSAVTKLATDAAGNSYAAGTFTNAQTGVDLDPGNNVHLLVSQGNSPDIFFAGYDPAGIFRWAFALGATGNDMPDALAANAAGDLVLSAVSSNGLIDADPGTGTTMVGASPHYGFITCYDAAGNFRTASELSGPPGGSAGFTGMVLDTSGALYTCGIMVAASIDFDMGAGFVPLNSVGYVDAFIAVYPVPGDTSKPIEEEAPVLSVLPNPAGNFEWISFPDDNFRELFIYDAGGKLVLQEQCEENRFGLNLAALAQGMYVLEIKEANEKTTHQKFVKQ